MNISEIKIIAVLGAGTMGNGIAHVFARAGYEVILRDVEERFLKRALDSIGKNLDREIKKGKLASNEKERVLSQIEAVTNIGAIGRAHFAIEAVPERLTLKSTVLAEADCILPPDAILATNTSSISVTALGAATNRPDLFVGMHFMNPVPVMPLIEVIRSKTPGDAAFNVTLELCK